MRDDTDELDRERRRNARLEHSVRELTRSVRELETFARDVSHDLAAPLAGISGYAQLLTHLDLGADRPAGYDELLGEIDRYIDRMRWLIDDVLASSTATATANLTRG